MATENGAYRWWENYLVRYLMPSIAGAAIVNWLVSLGNCELKALLLLELGSQGLQTPTLVLLFFYGNLFCYISSYPILGFHATRVVDFKNGEWHRSIRDGYISTLLLALVVFILCAVVVDWGDRVNQAIPFIIVLGFSGLQLYRLILAFAPNISDKSTINESKDKSTIKESKIYAYARAISKERSVAEEKEINEQETKNHDEEAEWTKRFVWRREIIDTYRHMREHGNSAFIFVLELTLAGLCYLILLAYKSETGSFQLSALGLLFVIWAIPAMFIHFAGQHIERKFSRYDK